ncbi:MAG: DUF11 domain-containing protein [Anaerolineae bacterium]|nr:DUF11 domain-containing protein [Anaerolineae bacterium]
MLKQTLIIIGTIFIGFGLVWVLLWGTQTPLPIAAAPASAQDGSPRPRSPAQSVPCIQITSDLTGSTTWNAPCYRILTNTVTIPPTATLAISPPPGGTRIEFDAGAEFHVRGSLYAIGNATRTITFTSILTQSAAPCDWGGIVLENDNRSDLIQYAVIEYACAGILINDQDSIEILSSTFRFNGNNGTPDDGAIVGTTDNHTRIAGNQIYSCSNGISLKKSFGNEISHNRISEIGNNGIALIREGAPGGDGNLIAYNQISQFGGRGIWIEEGNNNVFLNNEIFAGNGDGICLQEGDGNAVLSNTLYLNASGGLVLLDQTGVDIQYNTVYTNGGSSAYHAGFYAGGANSLIRNVTHNIFYDGDAPAIEFGSGTATCPGAVFQENALCSSGYKFVNNGYSVNAPHNWWSSNILPNGSLSGTVTFTPWITLAIQGDAGGGLVITLRDMDGYTVPEPPTQATALLPPNPRRIQLSSNWGTIEDAAVILDDAGTAQTRLVAGSGPAPNPVVITATDFCNYAITGTLAMPNLAITKTAAITRPAVGQVFTYTLEYANNGDAEATHITLTDQLPLGMILVGDTAPAPWARITTPHNAVWTRPALATGEQGSFAISVTVETTAACNLPLTNRARIDGAALESRLDDNESNATPVDIFYPDLSIQKSAALPEVAPGAIITYSIRYQNAGSAPAQEATIADRLPAGTAYVGDDSGLSHSGSGAGPIVWNAGTLAAHSAPVNFTLVVQIAPAVASGATLTNSITISSTTPECESLDNNSDTATVNIRGGVDMFAMKDDNVGPLTGTAKINLMSNLMEALRADKVTLAAPYHREFVFAGDLITYPIVICNNSAMTATGVVAIETIPAFTTYVEHGFGWTHSATQTYTLTVGALGPHTCRPPYFMVVRVNDPLPDGIHTLDNLVCARAAENELYPLDNCNHEDTPVLQRPEIQKTAMPVRIVGGEIFAAFTIHYRNPNAVPLSGVRITDTLPAGLSWYSDTALLRGWSERTLAGQQVGWYTPTLGAHAQGSFNLSARVILGDPVQCDEIVTNTVVMTVRSNNVDYLANSDEESFAIPCPEELEISKSAPICVDPGEDFNYTVYYSNTNAGIRFDTIGMTDTLPEGVSYRGPGAWQCNGRTCGYTIPSIPASTYAAAGPALPVHLDAAYSGASITNVVAIESGNTFTLVTRVGGGTDLVVVKNDNVGPLPSQSQKTWNIVEKALFGTTRPARALDQPLFVRPGDAITYTILYLNNGDAIAHNVVITEQLPDHTRYVGGGWSYAIGPYYTFAAGNLAPHSGGELHFIVEVFDPLACGVDRILNRVAIGGDEVECETLNNTANDDTPVQTDIQLVVANRDSNSLDLFSTTNFAHLSSTAAGPSPFGMAAYDDRLYVVNSTSPGNVTIFDIERLEVADTAAAGYGSLMAAAANGYIYVTNHGCCGSGISIIGHSSGDCVSNVYPDGAGIADWSFFGITYDYRRDRFYTTKRYMGGEGIWTLSPYPNATLAWVADTRPGPNGLSLPYSIVYAEKTDRIYVTFPHLNQVRVYDPDTFAQMGTYPTQAQSPSATDPGSTDGGKGLDDLESCVYNSNYSAGSVTVLAEGPCISPDYLAAPGIPPEGTAILPPPGTGIIPGRSIYLPFVGRNATSTSTPPVVTTHIPVNGNPKGLVAGNGCVFVALPAQNRVAVIDARTQSIIHEISTYGAYPQTVTLIHRGASEP